MKRWSRTLFVLSATALFAIGFSLFNKSRVGRVQDRYREVPVYDNGLIFVSSHGRHFSTDGYYYGQKWQCVEYIKRFYHQAIGHKMPEVMGHAKSFFDPAVPDGGVNRARGLLQFRNGSRQEPKPDDLLVFTDTKYGHVGIVTATGSNWVEMIQQNILGRTRERFTLIRSNELYLIAEPRKPAGWLRKGD